MWGFLPAFIKLPCYGDTTCCEHQGSSSSSCSSNEAPFHPGFLFELANQTFPFLPPQRNSRSTPGGFQLAPGGGQSWSSSCHPPHLSLPSTHRHEGLHPQRLLHPLLSLEAPRRAGGGQAGLSASNSPGSTRGEAKEISFRASISSQVVGWHSGMHAVPLA